MRDAILSLDIGTTVVKAVLFDLAGQELAVAEQGLGLHRPQPGWAELDPEEMWQAVAAVARVAGADPDRRARVRAVGLATQGGTLIAATADGQPLGRAITWMDRRADGIVAGWQAEGTDEEIRRISGWSPQAGLPLPVICWLRGADAERFARAQRFLSVNDYVGHKLTGTFASNRSMAGEMLLADTRTGQWSEALCELAGIEPEQLSPIVDSEAVIGEVSREASRLTGLAVGTPVVAGGQDHACEGLALGMAAAGGLWLACGTAWVLNGIAEGGPVESLPAEMDLNFHVVPDRWTVSRFLGGFGAGLDWWLAQCWREVGPQGGAAQEARYAAFHASLQRTDPGSGGLLCFPVNNGRRVGSRALPGGFSGLRLDHRPADLGRAVLEGAAYEVRWALEEMRQAGLPVGQMWMVGGATRSPVWPQIVADVSGVGLALSPYSHGPALGAALLAGRGLGLLDEAPEGAPEGAPGGVRAERIEPNRAHSAIYAERFAAYRRIAGELVR